MGDYIMNYSNNVLPEGSICENCVYCMRRIIEPLEDSEFDLNEETKDGIFVQVLCLLSDMDLHDCITRECTQYKKEKPGLFIENRFI
jgi:hypothetical protein